MKCDFQIDGKPFEIEIEGEAFWGRDEVLYLESDSFRLPAAWEDQGATQAALFSRDGFLNILSGVRQKLTKIFEEIGIDGSSSGWSLEKYHEIVASRELHQAVILKTRDLRYSDFNIDPEDVCRRVSDVLGRRVGTVNPLLKDQVVILRISRPSSLDINPPHRDGYLDVWKNTINLWIPLVGCDEKTSLPVIPGSHLWSEKDVFRTGNGEAKISGLNYRVPAIIDSKHGLSMQRCNPSYGEALIFSPFLVHGAAINSSDDVTRMSFELRLQLL
jgi:hypothetical protein